MNLLEIVPAHSYEHKRRIRQMARGVTGPNPITMGLVELGVALLSGGVMAACVLLFVRWWMGL